MPTLSNYSCLLSWRAFLWILHSKKDLKKQPQNHPIGSFLSTFPELEHHDPETWRASGNWDPDKMILRLLFHFQLLVGVSILHSCIEGCRVVSFPTRWSLYLPMALYIDHLSILSTERRGTAMCYLWCRFINQLMECTKVQFKSETGDATHFIKRSQGEGNPVKYNWTQCTAMQSK